MRPCQATRRSSASRRSTSSTGELARDGGEALEVPASLAQQYGLFPEDVGTEDEIREAGQGPNGPEEEVDR